MVLKSLNRALNRNRILAAGLFAWLATAPAFSQENYVASVPASDGSYAFQTVPAHTHPGYTNSANPLPLSSNANNQPLMSGYERQDVPIAPYVPGQPLVLMAISGGGSRSAYYAARVMEELAHVPLPGIRDNQPLPDGRPLYSLLDSVRVISTVSAGGLAASWYVTNFDYRKQPDFFANLKKSVSVNLQWRTYGHMALFPPSAVQLLASSVTRTDLLAKEIDKLIGGKEITFNDLQLKENRAVDPAPILCINGTVYNSGQRLVMTNLPGSRFPSLLGKNSGSQIAMPDRDEQILANLVQPMTFADIGSDIGTYKVSKALAASAAYPILLAPVPLRIFPANVPAHLLSRVDDKLLKSAIAYVADGGLYENQGVDPLLSIIKTLPKDQPVLVVIVDGSQRMETLQLGEGKIWGPVSSISRMYDIGTLKPLSYYRTILREYHEPSKLEMVFIRMEGSSEEAQRQLKNIPTMFKLSDAHCATLDQAAKENFSQMKGPLLDAFSRLSQGAGKKTASKK